MKDANDMLTDLEQSLERWKSSVCGFRDEMKKAESDRVFRRSLERVCEAIAHGGDIHEALRDCARDFRAVRVDKSRPKPLVGIVGEIFVRHNEAANANLVERLETLGLEVDLASVSEWVYYTNFCRRRSSFAEKNFSALLSTPPRTPSSASTRTGSASPSESSFATQSSRRRSSLWTWARPTFATPSRGRRC